MLEYYKKFFNDVKAGFIKYKWIHLICAIIFFTVIIVALNLH